MTGLELLLSLLAAFGLVCLVWLGAGWLTLPLRCPPRIVLEAHGHGEELEQAVRGLLWLRRTGLWRGTVVIRDEGLYEEGLMLGRAMGLRSRVKLVQRPGGM